MFRGVVRHGLGALGLLALLPRGLLAGPTLAEARAFVRTRAEALPPSRGATLPLRQIETRGVRIYLVGDLPGVEQSNPADLARLHDLETAAGVRTPPLGETSDLSWHRSSRLSPAVTERPGAC